MKVKDLGTAAKKFSQNASAGSSAYLSGVQSNTDWAANTAAAQDNWAQGVTTAASNKRFAAGVNKAGQSKYTASAATKGQQRYQQGVSSASAQTNWSAGFQPYAQVLNSLTLPARGVRGSPNNIQIVATIAQALHAAKMAS